MYLYQNNDSGKFIQLEYSYFGTKIKCNARFHQKGNLLIDRAWNMVIEMHVI